MGLTFLREHNGRRAGLADTTPDLFGDSSPEEDGADMQNTEAADAAKERVDLALETPKSQWKPISVGKAGLNDERRPTRFVDGKDVGRTAAWMQSPDGRPVPLRVAQIGAVTLRSTPGLKGCVLRAEVRQVEKVVAFMADLFPWDEVESFAAALRAQGYRLLPVNPKMKEGVSPYDYGKLRASAKSATINAMFGMERFALKPDADQSSVPPTLLDGSLQTKSGVFAPADPIVGVVKTHTIIPLHPLGFQTLAALGPFQRTPYYLRRVEPKGDSPQEYVTWFLRLGGLGGDAPDRCAVRVEINRAYLAAQSDGADYVNRLSRFLCDCRTRDNGYGRAAITVFPIQRAEDLLRAQFAQHDTLVNRFFRITNL